MKRPLLIYADYLPTATVTATDTAAGHDAADILEAEEDNVWVPANYSGTKSLTIDLGAPRELGSLGIAGEYLNGVTLEVRASSDNFASSNVLVSASATVNDFIATWRAWNNVSYRYWRLIFTNITAGFCIAHAALCRYDLLPWLNDNVDPDAFQTTGTQLISPDGHYLGANRSRSMRVIELPWGKVNEAAYLLFQRWAEACVHQMRAFFLVPDSSQAACRFCWLSDPKFVFKAPRSSGVRSLPTITVTSRLP